MYAVPAVHCLVFLAVFLHVSYTFAPFLFDLASELELDFLWFLGVVVLLVFDFDLDTNGFFFVGFNNASLNVLSLINFNIYRYYH